LWLAFAYGVGWPLQQAVHFDFHEIAFAVPLIALLVDAMDRRADRTVLAVCLVLLLVREDMGAMVALVGVLVALRRVRTAQRGRRRNLALGGLLIGLGGLGYWLATSVVIPAMGGGFTYWTFSALGPDPASAIRTMITRPWRVAWLMVTPAIKARTLTSIFLPTGFLALGSPYTLLTFPFLAERMLNDRPLLWQTNFHYTSVIAPILVMGAADTVARLTARFPGVFRARPVLVTWPARLARPARSIRPARRTRTGAPGVVGRPVRVGLVPVWVTWCVGAVVVGMATGSSLYPITGLWNGRVWQRNARWHAVNQTLPLIPSGQCVEADNQIAPQLTPRDYVTRVTMSGPLATWAVLDMQMKETGWQGPTPAVALPLLEARGFQVVSWKWPIILLHRDVPVQQICHRLY
jgi:hypothetical protein